MNAPICSATGLRSTRNQLHNGSLNNRASKLSPLDEVGEYTNTILHPDRTVEDGPSRPVYAKVRAYRRV